ncbi:hypothetical protein [Larkinella sp. C7]|uniref:hypothetical protein n=1 Tax=Larkinella sp. C7 TaxID=2576607 RepID=UPI001E659733|nr:hypothetical protein [Larkinella sp. C7]
MTRYNNWFAFKKNSRNLHADLGKSSYCIYATVGHSLTDYRLYEQMVIEKYGIRTESAYRSHIATHYAYDRRYGQKLQKAIEHTKTL